MFYIPVLYDERLYMFLMHDSYISLLKQSKPFPVAQYGGRFTVTMVPGDGIGPEMMGYVKNIFR